MNPCPGPDTPPSPFPFTLSEVTEAAALLRGRIEADLCQALVGDGDLLAVGVGARDVWLRFVEDGRRVIGVDNSVAAIERSRERAGELAVELHRAAPDDLPFPAGSYGNVIALGVLGEGDWRPLLAEWARVAVPGGRLVFDMVSGDHLDAAGLAMSGGPPRLREIAEEADRLGLAIAAVMPFGLLLPGTTAWMAELDRRHDWARHLSWLPFDARFFEFACFLELHCLANLSPAAAGRVLVALDSEPDPARNRQWLDRFQAIDTLARERIDAEVAAALLPMSVEAWREALSGHLDYPRNRVLLYRLMEQIRSRGLDVDWQGILPPAHWQRFQDWADQEAVDARAVRLLEDWHRQAGPELEHAGVELGAGMEYALMRHVLEDYFRLFPDQPASAKA